MPSEQPCSVFLHVSRGVPRRVHVPLRMAFNRVLAYIRHVADDIQVAGRLHPTYNQEDNATKSVGSESEEIDSGNETFNKDA